MSHRSPFRPAVGSSARVASRVDTSAAYTDLHRAHTHEDASSDDDEIDPRWTNRRVTAAQQQQRAASPLSSSTEGRSTNVTGSPSASSRSVHFSPRASGHHPNFPRRGYTATPNPLETSVGTTGLPGLTTHSAQEVVDRWKKSMGHIETDGTNTTRGDQPAEREEFSAIPVPQVDLTGMTDEQRELLEYYQARVDAFDRERVDFLHRLDEMAGNSKEKHSLKWDLHKKDEQLMDLQKALSDAHVFLYEERAQVLKLTAENDRLKIQEMEDRQRIEHLLALTQPINQEVTYFRECRPEKLTKNYPGQRDDIYAQQKDMSVVENALDSPRRQVLQSARSNTSDTSFGHSMATGNASLLHQSHSQFGSQSTRPRSAVAGSGRPGSSKKKSTGALRPVVRTIYLPNENIDILKQIIASLRAQLTEQHTLFEQRIQALQEDRAIREQETAEVQRKANMHMEELAKELKSVSELNKLTTRDYLELRHAAQLSERKLKERASALSQQQFDLHKHLKEVETKAVLSEAALQNENASYVSMFRQQTAATEEDLAIMKAQYAATQDLYEKRIRYLETRIVTIKQKLATVTERRALELEGYTTDITHLREKVRKLDNTMANFKAQQIGAIQADADIDRAMKRGAKCVHGHLQEEKTRDGELPPRVSAQFELLGADAAHLQQELTHLARKINST